MASIYGTLRDAALIQKAAEAQASRSRGLRPQGDYIRTTRGNSSGPLSFMRLFDYSTQINRLGGTRAGAKYGRAAPRPSGHRSVRFRKARTRDLTSFNLSVMATDAFAQAVKRGERVALHFASGSNVPNHVGTSMRKRSLTAS